ncbi:MAG TPA: hypothetical protein VGK56_12925 [Anaerolineales bacterium]
MHTRYVTFILRLRLDEEKPENISDDKICGSLHRIGLEEIHYFDSLLKLEQALYQLVLQAKNENQF